MFVLPSVKYTLNIGRSVSSSLKLLLPSQYLISLHSRACHHARTCPELPYGPQPNTVVSLRPNSTVIQQITATFSYTYTYNYYYGLGLLLPSGMLQ